MTQLDLRSLGMVHSLIVVSNKHGGSDFTGEDELLLSHLASMTSLAMQHIEARAATEHANRAKDNFLATSNFRSLHLLGRLPKVRRKGHSRLPHPRNKPSGP